jgi:predicted ATPase/DNA-binding CsgD family transcriptional regulator
VRTSIPEAYGVRRPGRARPGSPFAEHGGGKRWDDSAWGFAVTGDRPIGAPDPPAPERRGAARRPGELPRPRTSFVGRADELAELDRLLDRTRLLTVTGPGGCGKTRLAIAFAERVTPGYPDGVHFVPLAAIRDPALVPVSIAQCLGLQDSRGTSLHEHVTAYLGQDRVLLLLDNFEQVLAAGEFVSDLLTACPQLRIVVTSRAPLHVSGEQEFPLGPLRLPTDDGTVAAVSACESAHLFAARGAASVPGFRIDEGNVDAIVGIVRRLDGLPLAIELAAARVKVLPPAAIMARLEDSLALLVGAGRDVPDRQRTLRATITWSYELLSEPARRLLAAMSVFRGGADLDGLEAICATGVPLDAPVLDVLQELVDHNLVRLAATSASVPRYTVLETVREFAADHLASGGDAETVRRAHAAHFGRLAADLARPPAWPGKDGLDRLELEHDNFRSALDWYRRADPAAALHLANRLTAFWSARGHFSEGRRRLRELLDLVPADDPERIDALSGLAWLATDQGDRDAAIALLDESIERARARDDFVREATALNYRGRINLLTGEPANGASASDISRALALHVAAGDEAGLATALWFAGLPHMFEEQIDVAREKFEHCAELALALELPAVRARALQLVGVCQLEVGDLDSARRTLAEGVPAVADLGDRFAIPVGLTALAGLAALRGRARTALRLAGAAAAYEDVNHTYRPQAMRRFLDRWLEPARAAAGSAAPRLFDEGRRLGLEEAITLGLDDTPEPSPTGRAAAVLTPRESEVAALVARGLTNRDIAGQLYLSVRTVEVHVDHILTKLDFRTRTQLAGWVLHEGGPGRDT